MGSKSVLALPRQRPYPSGMSLQPSGELFRVWPRVRPFVRILLLAVFPVPDLISRHRVRRAAGNLMTCDPWPGMAATGPDAAQIAILRLLFLQRQTRRAVRSRQAEAATMLARASIEALITGLYCLHEPEAVSQLQGEHIRSLPLLLEYLSDAGVIPASVLAECISRLDLGTPARGPSVETMAQRVDRATGGSAAVSLYKRFYRPTSNLAVHVGAASLMRHVRVDHSIRHRPEPVWARRSPTRIADACLGTLTAAAAEHAGAPCQQAVKYADRHSERALTPVAVMSAGGFKRSLRPHQLITAIRRIRSYGDYVWSAEDAEAPDARYARIRADMESLLFAAEPDIPAGSLDPFLDYVAAKLVSESAPVPR